VAPRWSTGVAGICHPCGQRAEGFGGDNRDSSFCPMANDLLLTAHHREAMANACDRGFWMPMALTANQASQLTHLTAVHHGSDAIGLIARISSMALWSERDGISLWLPFVDWLLPLLRPVPLGSRQLLSVPGVNYVGGSRQLRRRVPPHPLPWQGVGCAWVGG